MYVPEGSSWQSEYLNHDMSMLFSAQEAAAATATAAEQQATRTSSSSAASGAAPPPTSTSGAGAVDGSQNYTPNGLRLPTAEELPAWVEGVVAVHGPEAIVKELIKLCPAETLQQMCDRAWGVRSDDADEQSRRVRAAVLLVLSTLFADCTPCTQVAIGEAPLVVTTPTTGRHGGQLPMHDRRPAPSSPVGTAGIIYRQCWNCAPSFGHHEEVCVGMALLEWKFNSLWKFNVRRQKNKHRACNGRLFVTAAIGMAARAAAGGGRRRRTEGAVTLSCCCRARKRLRGTDQTRLRRGSPNRGSPVPASLPCSAADTIARSVHVRWHAMSVRHTAVQRIGAMRSSGSSTARRAVRAESRRRAGRVGDMP